MHVAYSQLAAQIIVSLLRESDEPAIRLVRHGDVLARWQVRYEELPEKLRSRNRPRGKRLTNAVQALEREHGLVARGKDRVILVVDHAGLVELAAQQLDTRVT